MKRFLRNRDKEAKDPEGLTPGADAPKYWLNFDSTGVKLHKDTCKYVVWAVEPKWQKFDTEDDVYASTSRKIEKGGCCWYTQ